MILPDHEIIRAIVTGRLLIAPYNQDNVQPASIDVTLSDQWLTETGESFTKDTLVLAPKHCILGATIERFTMPRDLVGELAGRSSIGRLFIAVHCTAGYIDPTFDGTLTLEIANIGTVERTLYAGMRIGQVSFTEMTSPCERTYVEHGGHYQGQVAPTPSQIK